MTKTFDWDNMCLGSEELARKANVGGHLICPRCDSWVPSPFAGQLVPVHERPYTEAQEARFQRNAASIIRAEYRQARLKGTLISDPLRWHVTALEMARPRAFPPVAAETEHSS